MCNVLEDTTSSQPKALPTNSRQKTVWSSKLSDCCEDRNSCLLGCFCPFILGNMNAEKYGDCFLLPLLPGSDFLLRTGLRERYNIEGSILSDWCHGIFCGLCASCQLAREMDRRTSDTESAVC